MSWLRVPVSICPCIQVFPGRRHAAVSVATVVANQTAGDTLLTCFIYLSGFQEGYGNQGTFCLHGQYLSITDGTGCL
jgi:hypothetical protein